MDDTVQREILNVTLSAVADTEIVFGTPMSAFIIQNRDAQDMYFRVAQDSAEYWTIRSGIAFSLDFQKMVVSKIGFLRAAAGTGPAEIIGLREK
jgi:hypothetical protein